VSDVAAGCGSCQKELSDLSGRAPVSLLRQQSRQVCSQSAGTRLMQQMSGSPEGHRKSVVQSRRAGVRIEHAAHHIVLQGHGDGEAAGATGSGSTEAEPSCTPTSDRLGAVLFWSDRRHRRPKRSERSSRSEARCPSCTTGGAAASMQGHQMYRVGPRCERRERAVPSGTTLCIWRLLHKRIQLHNA
jgi:hypothetical protein